MAFYVSQFDFIIGTAFATSFIRKQIRICLYFLWTLYLGHPSLVVSICNI